MRWIVSELAFWWSLIAARRRRLIRNWLAVGTTGIVVSGPLDMLGLHRASAVTLLGGAGALSVVLLQLGRARTVLPISEERHAPLADRCLSDPVAWTWTLTLATIEGVCTLTGSSLSGPSDGAEELLPTILEDLPAEYEGATVMSFEPAPQPRNQPPLEGS